MIPYDSWSLDKGGHVSEKDLKRHFAPDDPPEEDVKLRPTWGEILLEINTYNGDHFIRWMRILFPGDERTRFPGVFQTHILLPPGDVHDELVGGIRGELNRFTVTNTRVSGLVEVICGSNLHPHRGEYAHIPHEVVVRQQNSLRERTFV